MDKTLKKTGAFKDEVSRRGRKERATTPFFPFFDGLGPIFGTDFF